MGKELKGAKQLIVHKGALTPLETGGPVSVSYSVIIEKRILTYISVVQIKMNRLTKSSCFIYLPFNFRVSRNSYFS